MNVENLRDLDYIQFGLLSAEEIVRQSVCEVSHLKLTGPNSVYDDRMGTLDANKRCATCAQDSKMCVGHFGHIPLRINILHPLFHKLALSILKCICYKCSRVLLTKEQLELNNLMRYNRQARFNKVMERMDRVDYCTHCETIQPRYVFSSQDRFIYMIFKMDGENSRVQMLENEIYKIFENVERSDVVLLGFDPEHFHPKSLVLTVLPVLPPVARPYIIADNMTCDDDLTIQYLEIVKANHYIGELSNNDSKRQKYIQALKFKIKSLFDNSGDRQRVSNGRPLKGIKKRLTGKEGIIRNNLMGKRVDKSARTVIGPDPTLCVDEIAVPPEIADTLSYSVRVTDGNMKEAHDLIESGRALFLLRDDGNTRINLKYASIRQGTKLHFGDMLHKKGGKWVLIRTEKDLFRLEEGDTVYRNGERLENVQYNTKKKVGIRVGDVIERKLQDGDVLLLNRQPTLHRGSMIAQKVRIRPGKTIRLNLAITSSFNADFDGDEMNLHCPASPETEAELRLLSSVRQNIISSQSSKANIIIVQDSLLGNYMMTKKTQAPLTREQFFQMAGILSYTRLEKLSAKTEKYRRFCGFPDTHYDGRMLFSLLLPDNFFYKNKNDADPEEPVVVIREGVLVQGAIKKTNLGSSHRSLITTLYQEYGEETCIQFINDVQFLSTQYLMKVGFSVGISDCIVTKKDEIQTKISKSFLKAKSIEEHTRDKRIREAYVTFALSGARDTGMAIAKNALQQDNHFIATVVSGAKGDYFNIAQVTGLLGQQNLNGQRILPQLSDQRRTLPHYPIHPEHYTDDMKYESAGFIRSSFVQGLSPREYFFHAMTGREGITDTAMKSVTWETRIFLMDNGRPLCIEFGRWADDLLKSYPDEVEHHKERCMELLAMEGRGVWIPTTDERGRVSWGEVTAVTRHDPGDAIYEVRTVSGRTVRVTESKSLIVWDDDLAMLVEKPTPEVVIGDCLPTTYSIGLPPVVLDEVVLAGGLRVKTSFENGVAMGYVVLHGSDQGLSAEPVIAGHLSSVSIPGGLDPDDVFPQAACAPHDFILGMRTGLCIASRKQGNDECYLKVRHASIKMMDGLSMLHARLGIFGDVVSTGDGFMWAESFEADPLRDVVLDEVAEITKRGTERFPKVYDMTVPSTLNFALANGLQVRDTATSGYIQRRMVKVAEDIQVKYDGTVRNSVNNVIQFAYGENFMDPAHTTFLGETAVSCDIDRLVERVNFEVQQQS